MKKTLALKLLCATITASSLIVVVPQLSTSCSKTKPVVLKSIPTGFFNISGLNILGWSDEVLAKPTLLKGYNFMQFDSAYKINNVAFYSTDPTKETAINACLKYVVKMDLSNLTFGDDIFYRADLSELKGTAGTSGTALVLPALLGDDTFQGTNFSGLTKLDLSDVSLDNETFAGANLSGLKGTGGTSTSSTALILPTGTIGNDTFIGANLSGLTILDLAANITLGASTFANANLSGIKGTGGTSGTALVLPTSLTTFAFRGVNLSGLTKLDVSNISVGLNSFDSTDLSGLKGTGGTSGTALVLPTSGLEDYTFAGAILSGLTELDCTGITIDDNTFDTAILSGITHLTVNVSIIGSQTFLYTNFFALKSMTFLTQTPPGNTVFFDATFNVDSVNKMELHLPSGTTTGSWNTWSDNTIGPDKYQYFTN